MIKTTIKEGKTYANIDDLRQWDKNPRKVTTEGIERLKKQIIRFKQYKPLIITSDGEIIGGNMRYVALTELGIKEVWVSVVTPKDEQEKIEYSLSDNDRIGYYDAEALSELVAEYSDFNVDDYAIDAEVPKLFNEVMDDLKFKDIEDDMPDEGDKNSSVISFKIPKEEEEWVKDICLKFHYDLVEMLKLIK